ncbi:hypothetical protein DPMN_046435 [Dreissena polymorpha]|uniref:BHLH domain-containing protein n=1 Tax=Dreissena polymorpha TaxID=45954 RepID=A0A9D4I0K8_DREPO|nr:hypothetical protein DPMN_046435 [Dreissena polymorpha]
MDRTIPDNSWRQIKQSGRRSRHQTFKHTEMTQHKIGNQNDCPIFRGQKVDPFSPFCLIPLPYPIGLSSYESPCFRRRNERERDRVRCVNDSYIRLKEHLPIENKDKRLSKVETLRCAINYIKYLQSLLQNYEAGKIEEIRFDIENAVETDGGIKFNHLCDKNISKMWGLDHEACKYSSDAGENAGFRDEPECKVSASNYYSENPFAETGSDDDLLHYTSDLSDESLDMF